MFVRPFIAVTVLAYLSNAQNACRTPDSRSGSCIPLTSCPSLYSLLTSPNINANDRNFLRRSQCGNRGGPLVCCASNQVQSVSSGGSVGGRVQLPAPGVCGVDSGDRIFGGTATKINQYPWMALLQYSKGGIQSFNCGGSLINENYVITAAHCVKGVKEWKLTSVRLGEWDITRQTDCDDSQGQLDCSDPPVDIPVKDIIPHESYNPAVRHNFNDIALLRLSRKVRYTDYIKPVCLPIETALRNLNPSGQTYIVAGWGRTEYGNKSPVKLQVQIKGVGQSTCDSRYNLIGNQIVDTQVCAGGDPNKDSCNGDSGGPLMGFARTNGVAYTYLAGLVSYGPSECGKADWPGVYTKVSSYIDWIQRTMKP